MSAVNPRRSLGQAGEEIAAHTLAAAGLTILARNWRCTAGELDIVAQDVAPDYASGELQAQWLVVNGLDKFSISRWLILQSQPQTCSPGRGARRP